MKVSLPSLSSSILQLYKLKPEECKKIFELYTSCKHFQDGVEAGFKKLSRSWQAELAAEAGLDPCRVQSGEDIVKLKGAIKRFAERVLTSLSLPQRQIYESLARKPDLTGTDSPTKRMKLTIASKTAVLLETLSRLPSNSQLILDRIDAWVMEAPDGENRSKFKACAKKFLAGEDSFILCENANLSSLPDIFAISPFPEYLRSLSLADNRLTQLPCSITELSVLQLLNLNNNRLVSLPDATGQLQALEHLRVENNQLRDFPPSMQQLVSLSEVRACGNQFTAFPHILGNLPQLERLFLASNRIEQIALGPNPFRQLIKLDLSQNPFTHIPGALLCLPHLFALSLGDDTEAGYLPTSYSLLRELKSFREELLKEGDIPLTTLPNLSEKMKEWVAILYPPLYLDAFERTQESDKKSGYEWPCLGQRTDGDAARDFLFQNKRQVDGRKLFPALEPTTPNLSPLNETRFKRFFAQLGIRYIEIATSPDGQPAQGDYWLLPSAARLEASWKRLQEQNPEKNFPGIALIPSSGIASDEAFLQVFLEKGEKIRIVVSEDEQCIHDMGLHLIPTLLGIFEAGYSGEDFLQERRRLQDMIQSGYDKFKSTKEKQTMPNYKDSVEILEKQILKYLGALVDVMTSKGINTKRYNDENIRSPLLLVREIRWHAYFKKEFPEFDLDAFKTACETIMQIS